MRLNQRALAAFALFCACGPIHAETMVASVYDNSDGKNYRVATGARFDPKSMTAAHKTVPFGTKLIVKYGSNYAEVTIDDRGPFVRGRELDLTPAVQKALHFPGLGRVRVEAFPPLPKPRPEIKE